MLKRLWSPTGLFDEIEFHSGINLILGKYADQRRAVDESGINGIGKSSVVRMIDYLLLSDANRKRFTTGKYAWMGDEGHSACLELDVAGTYVYIRRTFGKDSQEVAIRLGVEPEIVVDDRTAKAILGVVFFPPAAGRIGVDDRFRSLMPFYVKDDLAAHKRSDPVKFLSHGGANLRDITILTMYLLGLPNEDLVKLEDTRVESDAERRARDLLIKRLETDTGRSVQALRTELSNADTRLSELRDAVKDFNLLEDFKEVAAAMSKLEADASEQRKIASQSSRQIEKLRRFVEVTPDIDAIDVVNQYQEVSAALGAAMKKTVDEVLEFRRSLAQQRLRFHGKRLLDLEQSRDMAMRRLGELERARSGLMQAVNTTDFRETFENALQRLATEYGDLERQRAALEQLKQFDQRLSDFELRMQQMRHEAAVALREVEANVDAIRERFLGIVRETVTTSADQSTDAVFDISSQTGSAGKSLPVKITVSVPRVDALGAARLLLVAYDLTVLLHQVDEDLAAPRFLIHDGVFHAIARRTVVKTMNYVSSQADLAAAEGRPFQYITTFNEDELTAAEEERVRDGEYSFDVAKATVISVSDAPSGGLFKRRF